MPTQSALTSGPSPDIGKRAGARAGTLTLLLPPVACLYPHHMLGRTLFALIVLALGVLITVVNLAGGLRFSFPLLLGLLLIADGVLRLMSLPERT